MADGDPQLPLGSSPAPGGLTIPGPMEATQRIHVYLPEDLGAANQAMAQGFQNLSQQIGQLADSAAKQEGAVAGAKAGQDPNFKPAQSVTTTGTSFQHAAVNSYTSQLSNTARDTMMQVNDQFNQLPPDQQTPEKLTGMFKDAHDKLVQQHVVPEVQPQFDNEWNQYSRTYIQGAMTTHNAFVKNQAVTSFQNDAESSRNLQDRLASTPGPNSDAALATEVKNFNEKVDHAAAAGYITPEKAQDIKVNNQQENLTTGTLARVKALPTDQKAGFLDAFQEDYAKSPDDQTVTKGMNENTYYKTLGLISQQVRSDQSQAKEQSKQNVQEITGYTKNITDGMSVSESQVTALNNKYGHNTDPDTATALDTFNRSQAAVANLKGKSPAEVQASLDATKAEVAKTGASPEQKTVIDTAEKYNDTLRSDLAKDPLGRSVRDGVIAPIAPLDPRGDPTKFFNALEARIPSAEHTAEHYGTQTTYFTPDEISALKTVEAQGGDQQLAVAKAIAQAGGPQAETMLKQAGLVAPGLAHLAKLQVLNGDPEFQRDVANTQHLNNTDGGKASLERIKTPEAQDAASATYGTAFDNPAMRDFKAGAVQAATQAYQTEALRDPKLRGGSVPDPRKYTDDLQKAAGRTTDNQGNYYGGVATYQPDYGSWSTRASALPGQLVPIPPNMRQDQLGNVMHTLTDQLLAKQPNPPVGGDGATPVTVDQIRHGRLEAIGHGRYNVALGADDTDPQYVMTPGGQKYVLDLNQLEPILRRAIPGAYRTP